MEKVSDLVVDDAYLRNRRFLRASRLRGGNQVQGARASFPYLLEFSVRAFYPEHKDIKDTMDGWTQRQLDCDVHDVLQDACGLTGSATTSTRSTCSTC